MTGNIVSFDIGSAQIKLVWCAGGVCKAAVSAPVPDGLVRGGTIVSMDAMADFLKDMAKGNGIPLAGAASIRRFMRHLRQKSKRWGFGPGAGAGPPPPWRG